MESSNPEQPFVSVIVPVLNNAHGLKKCLDALGSQGYPKKRYEILVIDNGSKDNVGEVVDTCGQAKLLFEDYPTQAAARNKGISAAKGDILAFTDSDCIPATDWIERGVKNLLRIPNCEYVGGKINIFFRTPQKPTAWELYESVFAFPQKKYIEEKRYSTTANLFTLKSVFDTVGLFNHKSYTGSDEEWGKEVYSRGFHQVYADDVQILHPARYSWRQMALTQARIRVSRYQKALRRKPLSTNRQRLCWIVNSALLREFCPQMLCIFSGRNLSGVKQKLIVMYVLLKRLWFDYYIRLSILRGKHLEHDYELLRKSPDTDYSVERTP